tara:strand:- start:815 stop:1087 length:273 start_codon:yes stop_codon:yes gene_type:complete
MNIQEIYHGENTRMERDELRIVIDGKDLFFGTGLNEDGEAPTIDESIEKLKADKNWRTRVRIIQRISETTGSEYEMAVLSDVIKKASLDV